MRFQLSDAKVATFGHTTNRLLLQLVRAWHGEMSLIQDCHRLLVNDINTRESLLVAALKRGVGMRRYTCALCGLTFARRYRQLRSLVTCRLHNGGFTTLDERRPTRPEILLLWYEVLTVS